LNEEIEIIAKRLDDSGLANSHIKVEESRDDLVNRLNARITQLKLREEKLLEENARLEEMLMVSAPSS
jgi:cell shape-determining protein MreC